MDSRYKLLTVKSNGLITSLRCSITLALLQRNRRNTCNIYCVFVGGISGPINKKKRFRTVSTDYFRTIILGGWSCKAVKDWTWCSIGTNLALFTRDRTESHEHATNANGRRRHALHPNMASANLRTRLCWRCGFSMVAAYCLNMGWFSH